MNGSVKVQITFCINDVKIAIVTMTILTKIDAITIQLIRYLNSIVL